MAEYFENLAALTATSGTSSGPEMVKMTVDWEYERRRNSKIGRLAKHAGLAPPGADLCDLKAMPGRSIDTELLARSGCCGWTPSPRTQRSRFSVINSL